MDCGNIANRVKTRRKMKKIEKQTKGLDDAMCLLGELLEQEQDIAGSELEQENAILQKDLCNQIEKQRQFMYDKWKIEWLAVEEL